MKKKIACPVCKGKGYVAWINKTEDTCSAGCKMCPNCDGTGVRYVDMTNADKIRAMDDERLAKYISGLICDFNEGVEYTDNPREWLEWLQQPVKE